MLEELARQIAENGVKHVFGIPGSGTSLTVIDSLMQKDVRFHLTHFEGSAAIMAGVVGRLSGKAGVSIGIKGPGLYNAVAGMGECLLDAHPMVSVSEAYGPDVPFWKAHKRMDHAALVSGVSKGRFCLGDELSFDAISRFAEAEVPGPVQLDLAACAEGESVCPGRQETASSLSAKALDMVAAAAHPIVIAGSWADRKGLSSLLNGLRIPVFTTAAAKGVVDETLPQAAGVYTGAGQELAPEGTILEQADLVIGLGLRHNEILGVGPFNCDCVLFDEADESVWIGISPDEFGGWDESLGKELAARLSDREWGLGLVESLNARLRDHLLAQGYLPARVFASAENFLGGELRVVLDTGLFCVVGEHLCRVKSSELYVASGQARSMGVGLPQAVAASLYDPAVPTMLFTGDGGLGMYAAEIKMAVKEALPLVVVLMSDGMLGTLRPRAEKDSLSLAPLTLADPSWVGVMEGFGVRSVSARNEGELEKALSGWDRKGPLFLETFFDPAAYRDMVGGVR